MPPASEPPPAGASYDAIVVLGHHPPVTDDGRIESELAGRVACGVDAYRQGRAPRMVLVGGAGSHGVTEADAMASHARDLGVPFEALRTDARSRDTIDNARYARQLLCADAKGVCRPRVLLVTSDYHLPRALELFRCAGFQVDGAAAHLEASRAQRRRQRRHEAMTRLYYAFIDECARVMRPVE